jgi:hypothetical protein
MDDRRVRPEIGRDRARRRAAGLVAQYIHELSQRHTASRRVGPGSGPGNAARR